MDALGERIKRLRIQANLNKAALARKVGVSDVTISYWESGAIKQIGHARLVALADALGCSLGHLLDGTAKSEDSDRFAPTPLYLYSRPPAPWQEPNVNRLDLSRGLLAGIDWQGECYLVTPAPGEQFHYLRSGDLAAFAPATTCGQPGRYLIEGAGGLYIGLLEWGSAGELLCSNGNEPERLPTPLDMTERVVGRLLARWRQDDA